MSGALRRGRLYCSFGSCNVINIPGLPGYEEGIRFYSFPQPCLLLRNNVLTWDGDEERKHVKTCQTCGIVKDWMTSCKRDDARFQRVVQISPKFYICSKHFVDPPAVMDYSKFVPSSAVGSRRKRGKHQLDLERVHPSQGFIKFAAGLDHNYHAPVDPLAQTSNSDSGVCATVTKSEPLELPAKEENVEADDCCNHIAQNPSVDHCPSGVTIKEEHNDSEDTKAYFGEILLSLDVCKNEVDVADEVSGPLIKQEPRDCQQTNDAAIAPINVSTETTLLFEREEYICPVKVEQEHADDHGSHESFIPPVIATATTIVSTEEEVNKNQRNEEDFICESCGFQCNDQSILELHYSLSNDCGKPNAPIPPSVAAQTTCVSKGKGADKNRKNEEEGFICESCSFQCCNRSMLLRHYSMSNGCVTPLEQRNEEGFIFCESCGFQCNNQRILERHYSISDDCGKPNASIPPTGAVRTPVSMGKEASGRSRKRRRNRRREGEGCIFDSCGFHCDDQRILDHHHSICNDCVKPNASIPPTKAEQSTHISNESVADADDPQQSCIPPKVADHATYIGIEKEAESSMEKGLNQRKPTSIFCESCGFPCHNLRMLFRHCSMSNHCRMPLEQRNEEGIICEPSGFQCENQRILERRYSIPNDCRKPGKLFQIDEDLTCEWCGFHCKNQSTLDRHFSISNDCGKPYACQHCGKRYLQVETLRDHVLYCQVRLVEESRQKRGTQTSGNLESGSVNNTAICQEPQAHQNTNKEEKVNPCETNIRTSECTPRITDTTKAALAAKDGACKSPDNLEGERGSAAVSDAGSFTPAKTPKILNDNCGNKEVPYSCRSCGYKTNQKIKLERHRKASNTCRKLYECERRNRSYVTEVSLKNHLRKNRGTMVYSCDSCNYSTMDASSLKRHKIAHNGRRHGARSAAYSRITPKIPKTSGKTPRHATEKEGYSCRSCGFKCDKESVLKYHLVTENCGKPNVCGHCGKEYMDKLSLIEHKKEHSKMSPHACSSCDYTTHSRALLKRHKLVLVGEKPYECPVCNDVFKRYHRLKEHVRSHLV